MAAFRSSQAEHEMITRCGFICGCGHSGTTLIATILSAHPDVHLPFQETNIFFKWTPLAHLRFFKLKLAARRAEKSVLIEKTPRHIRRVDRIRRMVPGARFLIPVRDGRDVVASIAKRLGNPSEGLERWIADNSLVLAERSRPDVMVYRYEDLVEDPAGTIEGICAFLDLPFDKALLDYHQNQRRWQHGNAAQASEHAALRNRQVNQPIYDGRGRWRSELGPDELAELTKGRGRPLMEAFGYL